MEREEIKINTMCNYGVTPIYVHIKAGLVFLAFTSYSKGLPAGNCGFIFSSKKLFNFAGGITLVATPF